MDDKTNEQNSNELQTVQVSKNKGERVPEGNYLGYPAAKLHQFRWPLAPYKNIRLPLVPMEYLTSFTKNPPMKWHQEWHEVARAELLRRSSDPELKRVTFTEHVFERFTQLFPTMVVNVQNRCDKRYGIGAITIMKLLFLKALDKDMPTHTAKSNDNFRS